MEIPPEYDRTERLRDLAAASWNLELLISGAAIFLVSLLPGQVDKALGYYLENLAPDGNLYSSTLPLLAYSFFKMVAWLLTATFVVHFILRAFWVGLVGLHAVYPEGIRYARLPWQSDFSKELAERNFGQLSGFILRVDRLSNLVFSIAFLIALLGLGISLLYLVIFLLTNPAIIPEAVISKRTRIIAFSVVVAVLGFLPAAVQILLRRPWALKSPLLRRVAAWTLTYLPAFLLPVIYRPMAYINLVFSSNISRKRFSVSIALVSSILMAGVLWIFFRTNMHLAGRNPFVPQTYFATGNNLSTLQPRNYDNLRHPDDFMPPVSLSSDVVQGPVLRVFVLYQKWLDEPLGRFCGEVTVPDTLERTAKRAIRDSLRLDCLTRFFRLSVNDSVYAAPDWRYYTHPVSGSPGLQAYIPTASFSFGRNLLSVKMPVSEHPDSLQEYATVPFQYFPE